MVSKFALRRLWREKNARYTAYGWAMPSATFRQWAELWGAEQLKELQERQDYITQVGRAPGETC